MVKYIAVIAAVVAFAVTSLLGIFVIPMLKKLHIGQTILEDGPTWHQSKQGTPTMGGIMIIAGVIISTVICVAFALIFNIEIIPNAQPTRHFTRMAAGLLLALFMGAIGFVDDYIKVVKKRNLGLTARQKTFFQLAVSAAYLASLYFIGGMKTTYIPFAGHVSIDSGIGLIFWPIAFFFVYGFTNAVNLTDGLDGLVSSVTLVVSCFFMLASGSLLIYYSNMLAAAVAGACAGFLIWNTKPAKVFMGDTGSMFLGGMVVALSFAIDRPILLLFAGCIYLIEAVSVILQVAHFKRTKKRLLKMAPLHHHFEMCGKSEQYIVNLFSLITLIGCVLAFLAIILNF